MMRWLRDWDRAIVFIGIALVFVIVLAADADTLWMADKL